MKAFDYLFSHDNDWSNRTMYAVYLPSEKKYVQQSFIGEPWIRKLSSSKNDAAWMSLNAAKCLCNAIVQAGHYDAKVKKVHWWNVLVKCC